LSSALVLFRYVGPGGEQFVDFHWQPEPGEERELPADTTSPHLERVAARKDKTADDDQDARKPSKETR
jgi:hypothetical protein